MADPITILTIASSAMQAVGAIQQGNAAMAQARAQQNAANYNAQVKTNQATIERQQANAREEQQRRQARGLLGKQRAALTQAGIGLGGSVLDLEEQSAIRAELDALTIRYEGDIKSKGLLASAEQDRYEGEVALVAGKNAQKAAYISAGASILSGAASGYASHLKYSAPGAGSLGSGLSATSTGQGLQMSSGTGLGLKVPSSSLYSSIKLYP